ncbi:PIN domain-containing protein [Paludisphaera sp.]|uniref:type II toxin-antitoxin system VapC family toxin n=1 Tax=Paludisphaera sp. TaxID=2017432 RepID=UPI00301DAC65
MSHLLDTNILTRLVEPGHPMHAATSGALARIASEGRRPFLVPQSLYEFWVVATRPIAVNGLGRSPARVLSDIQRFQTLFILLDDSPAIYPAWKGLVATAGIVGKKAHDARLVAAMLVHGVDRLLTYNVQDFRPFAGIRAETPDEILAG